MKATSVGEYLIMFGALVAVVATAVISLGRMIVFQAQTAEERYAQSVADELASVINEVAASPSGAYFDIAPARTRFNITVTPTEVVLRWKDKTTIATHLSRAVIPVSFNSTDKLCVQKSLGKLLIKQGGCLDCTPGDGFCDMGCDALGKCDTDCIKSNDNYCSRSCAALADGLCDLDCVGKSDGIWDPDCGCVKGSEAPCVEDGKCDPDSGVLDFSWDPECTGAEGVCDPDYTGCDPDCSRDIVCRGSCNSTPTEGWCFPACDNGSCNSCSTRCAPGCSKKPVGWLDEFPCRIRLNSTKWDWPLFLGGNFTDLALKCGIDQVDGFRFYSSGNEAVLGNLIEDGNLTLVVKVGLDPQLYFNSSPARSVGNTDVWGMGNVILNDEIKVVVENGTVRQFVNLSSGKNLTGDWFRYSDEKEINEVGVSVNGTFAQINVDYDGAWKKYQMFSELPGVRMLSNYESQVSFEFPNGYDVWVEGEWGFASGDSRLMLWCKGNAPMESGKRLLCTSEEAWVFVCDYCSPIQEWLKEKEVWLDGVEKLVDQRSYSPWC